MTQTLRVPSGFRFNGITAGIKESGKKDLALVVLDQPGIMGGVYTKSKFPSAHVDYCRTLTPCAEFRALVVNSGNANAATGEEGRKRNLELASSVAREFDLPFEQVFTSSTGIIGQQLPIDLIQKSIWQLTQGLSFDHRPFAQAILTTDLTEKVVSRQLEIEGEIYQVLGIAKGSGMIMPNMGTMLAYILTDAPIPFDEIQSIAHSVADQSFNLVSVDGDTSTNDTFMLISSNPGPTPALARTKHVILEVAQELAKKIAIDGEGAKHLIELQVKSAPNTDVAKAVIMGVLNSPLVKTAIHGENPNWGRLIMAIGKSLEPYDGFWHQPISIGMQGICIFANGEPNAFDEESLRQKMAEFTIVITVDLDAGESQLTGWGCDLSREYISINADYKT